jgi:hypothetical protein
LLPVPGRIDAQDRHALGFVVVGESGQNGRLPLAVRSPRRPEIHQHGLSAQVLERHQAAVH